MIEDKKTTVHFIGGLERYSDMPLWKTKSGHYGALNNPDDELYVVAENAIEAAKIAQAWNDHHAEGAPENVLLVEYVSSFILIQNDKVKINQIVS